MSEIVEAIAARFHPLEGITAIRPLGNGNVNETFLVTHHGNTEGSRNGAFVLQRLNTSVFQRPDLVMRNLVALSDHMQRRLASPPPELHGRRWEVPHVVPCRRDAHWVEHEGQFWRSISYIGAATTADVIRDGKQAHEVGYGLGMFHNLVSDLPTDHLADTLEHFHVTPRYLHRYDNVRCQTAIDLTHPLLRQAINFFEARRDGLDVLENALARGELQHRPIHGDPKLNNVMIDDDTGQAIGLIDLDTVKPGLVHYDIGDCLRSCCNPVGEEASNPNEVDFDLTLCEAILKGYLSVAQGFFSDWDLHYLPACIRLIPLELGLRFLTDHLEGNVYFRCDDPEHNLRRATVQFQLTESIETKMPAIENLVNSMRNRRMSPV